MDRPQANRIVVEGMVIVVSILLAFSIDAWWDRSRQQAAEAEWVAAVQLDLETSIEQLDETIGDAEVLMGATSRLLELLRSPQTPVADSVRSLAQRVLRPIGFVPTLPGLESGFSEGRLSIIESVEFRRALSEFRYWLTHFENSRSIDWDHVFSGPLYELRAPYAGEQLFGQPVAGRFALTDEEYLSVMLTPQAYSAIETTRTLQRNQITGLTEMRAALQAMVSTVHGHAR